MRHLKLSLAFIFCLACAASAQADPLVIPVPLNSPVFVSLDTNPVLTIGPRTIDFSSSINQEFILFLPLVQNVGTIDNPAFRVTIGIRARDGLASLGGSFPLSPHPTFVNALPVFNFGTTDLLLFDMLIPGSGTVFTITATDLNGNTRVAGFSTPTPEPATLLLLSTGMVGVAVKSRRRFKRRKAT